MPTRRSASRECWLFFCATLMTLAMSWVAMGQETAKGPPRITVQLWIVEVSTDKLRKLGFDWSQISSQQAFKTQSIDSVAALAEATKGLDANEFLGFLKALEKNNLARLHAEPTIATRSGRQASLFIDDHLQLDVTPTVIDDQHVQLQYRIELSAGEGNGSGTASPLSAGSTVLVDVEKLCLVSQTLSSWQEANGKRRQTETLLLVRADVATAEVPPK
jgi:hypothetical protein